MNNNSYLRPELGKSYSVALKYPTPTPVQGLSGPELRWILTDGKALYTPVDFQEQVTQLSLKPGQRFSLIRSRQNGQIVWKAERLAQPAATLLDEAPALDSAVPLDDPPASPATRLESALKTAVHAAAAAEKHGAEIGYSLRFRPEDIRAMAISVLIGMDRRAA